MRFDNPVCFGCKFFGSHKKDRPIVHCSKKKTPISEFDCDAFQSRDEDEYLPASSYSDADQAFTGGQ